MAAATKRRNLRTDAARRHSLHRKVSRHSHQSPAWYKMCASCPVVHRNGKVVAGHRNSPIKEYPPTVVFASKLIMGFWLFVVTKRNALMLGRLLRDADGIGCAQARSFWFDV
jgi:hypothetical protein